MSDQESNILFGGVDAAKFSGDLVTLDIELDKTDGPHDGTYSEMMLNVTGFAANIGGSTSSVLDRNVTALLDTGVNGIRVPMHLYDAIAPELPLLNATDEEMDDWGTVYPVVLCDYDSSNTSFTITLSDDNGKSADIDVPVSELITPIYSGAKNSTVLAMRDGQPICDFGLWYTHFGYDMMLGDSFLRSAYTFFNLDQKTISLAQAVYNTTATWIVPIGPGPVPAMTGNGTLSL